MPKNHSYEEIRSAVLDILAGREKADYDPSQYVHLRLDVAALFAERESTGSSHQIDRPNLAGQDADLFLEVFWDLFRQGIITLGLNDSNPQFPFFRVSHFGKAILEHQQVYFFHDVSTYEALIKSQVPKIDVTTLLYLKEAMQAFRAGCILSATVMLGVATEHTFLALLEIIDANPKHQATYAAVRKERSILPKINKFRTILDKQLSSLPGDVKEDLDTQFAGIQSVIRGFRNDAGHPTGKIIDREQAYVLLSLFVPYAKKMYQLIDHFSSP
jgi:hypothetical protein